MDGDHELKHICKFCNKSFPCGRSLGGHMRSHLINSSSDRDHKFRENRPLPLPDGRNNAKFDKLSELGSPSSYGLRENPKKTRKFSKPSDQEDTLLQDKICKECGRSFHSWKALFGHMKSHSVNRKIANTWEDDSWDSQSDNESAAPFCKKKRSNRMKRYTSTTNSSSLANFSPCVSEIDQQVQEEVALSLIMLSRDTGNWGEMNSSGSSYNSLDFSGAKKFGKISGKGSFCSESKFKKSKDKLKNTRKTKNLDQESEVNSPRNPIQKSGLDQFEGLKFNKAKSSKGKCIGSNDSEVSLPVESYKSPFAHSPFEKTSKFLCTICQKAFTSYQALGGHRASHKKFKGCCAPRIVGFLKIKEHECPICFKIFPSGQALGGHKRSHLISDQPKSTTHPSVVIQMPSAKTRDFLDLNLPAPVDHEEWWIGISNDHESGIEHKRPLLGFLSS
ncbi:uncharacterized protein [Henckelia pumila]|uniref:uncharacterized protein n=1 Tax=Henckelia pumila TaxID=405737 RepID=UPI003C6E0434